MQAKTATIPLQKLTSTVWDSSKKQGETLNAY